ncbi:hypothetical protein, partial [Glutamicibacter arilaitensis]
MTDHFTDQTRPPSARAAALAPLNSDGWSLAVVIFAAQMLVIMLVVIGLAVATYKHQAQVILDDKQ